MQRADSPDQLEHVHKSAVLPTGNIVCKECGEQLERHEEIITKSQSAKRAKRMVEEIAVSGHYCAQGYANGYVVYGRDSEKGLHEEVFVRKINDKDFHIIKIVSKQEVAVTR